MSNNFLFSSFEHEVVGNEDEDEDEDNPADEPDTFSISSQFDGDPGGIRFKNYSSSE